MPRNAWFSFGSWTFKKFLFSSSLIAPGATYVYKNYGDLTPDSLPLSTQEDSFHNLSSFVFGEEKFPTRDIIFPDIGDDREWIRIFGELDYEKMESMRDWQDKVDQYNGSDSKSDTSLYNFLKIESAPYWPRTRSPHYKSFMDHMDVKRLMIVCRNLWKEPGTNHIKSTTVREWCTRAKGAIGVNQKR